MGLQVKIQFRYQENLSKSPYVDVTLESMTLDTLAPLTPTGKDKQWGRWTSQSRFIGMRTSGKYYVTEIHPSEEEEWAHGGSRYNELNMNPIAYFFDSSREEPFMALYQFAPMTFSDYVKQGLGVSSMSWEAVFYGYVDQNVAWIYGEPEKRGD